MQVGAVDVFRRRLFRDCFDQSGAYLTMITSVSRKQAGAQLPIVELFTDRKKFSDIEEEKEQGRLALCENLR